MSLEIKARSFCIGAHSAVNQKRKWTGEPYYRHPIEVAETLKMVGFQQAVVAAGYLHDTVEDTGVTLDIIRAEFGESVAELVDSVTLDVGPEYGNRALRKEYFRRKVGSSSPLAHSIKLADMISNLPSVVEHDSSGFAWRYLEECKLMAEVCSGGHPELHKKFNQVVSQSTEYLNNIEQE